MGDIRASDQDALQSAPASAAAVTKAAENEITVLVTGFGPFLNQFPINPSHEITKHLPTTIPLPASSKTIRLLPHPAPLRVAYHPTATHVPSLLAHHSPDLALHIGLAAGRSYFAIERSSARAGYARNDDVDGRRWTLADSDRAWPAHPDRLETGLRFDGVWERWAEGCAGLEGVEVGPGKVLRGRGVGVGGRGMEGVPEGGPGAGAARESVAVRPSDDVGSFLCGFIYYTSLAWWWEREGEVEVKRPVLFLHVPACPDERDVERGRDITVELIKAMVGDWLAQKEEAKKEKGEEEKGVDVGK
ncbi:hypothetical protein GTA08_BOTSDO06451 [Neofusicoccum parvum]|uniref:Uncharacterized protein n=1 Tax=Neofusicoccum parvum TaxID=310453 RepID=A0ACB5RZ55_9PEZI|nr:hypothetical protein GTA08_BOTSDO06451 [Neofusicoccum parvum]